MRVSPFVYFNEVPQVAAVAGLTQLPVTRGLYGYYDAAFSESYSGSGTNINDLGPNNKDGTLNGTWTWETGSDYDARAWRLGALGTTNNMQFPTFNPATTGEITFFVSFYLPSNTTYAFDAVEPLVARRSSAGNGYGIFALGSNYTYKLGFGIDDNYDLTSAPNNSSTGSQWHVAGFSFKDSTNTGNFVADGVTGSFTLTANMTNGNFVRPAGTNQAGVPGRQMQTGSLFQVYAMYTSSLSTDELLENYNAIKDRYGL